ncbi:MAG TPA: exosortase A, partial [Gammaproteobacteria bacterium]|nr:exosortase A [Gammaproteobacteria bacterium]
MPKNWTINFKNDPLKVHAINFVIILLFFLYFYRSTLFTLIEKYATSGTYAHGFLILPIVLWLIFQRRHYFKISIPNYEPLGFIGILVLSLLWYVAGAAFVDIIQQLCLCLMLIVLFISFFGLKISLKFLFPLAYLLFAIPFGNFLTPFLQHITTHVSAHILHVFGIPVYFEGLTISTSQGEFEVAEACSGIRYIIATVTLGVLYAYYTYQNIWKRIIFSVICLVFPIIANCIRVFFIILIAHGSGMKYALGVDHLIYGWIFFGI